MLLFFKNRNIEEYIKRETAIAIIKEKQRELCPVGRYGREYIYGSDREKYDAWDEIINALENEPAADVAPVVHAKWITRRDKGIISMTHPYMCSRCWRVEMDKEPYCNCGAKMDGGDDHAST